MIPTPINDFIANNEIATICFIDKQNAPYCINCFYAYDSSNKILVFKSSPGTHHHSLTITGNKISGTILPKEINPLKIIGAQITGTILTGEQLINSGSNSTYYKKHPFAIAMPGYIWAIKINWVKLTDNSVVFGTKTIWKDI